MARQFCSICPVVVDCLEEAISVPDTIGFWGATSDYERRTIQRLMKEGLTLEKATEKVWSHYRQKNNWELKVPNVFVWQGL